jgi:hypothetical protein
MVFSTRKKRETVSMQVTVDLVHNYLGNNPDPNEAGIKVAQMFRDVKSRAKSEYYMNELSGIQYSLKNYFKAPLKLDQMISRYLAFKLGYHSVIHEDAVQMYGPKYDQWRSMSANTFFHGNMSKLGEIFTRLIHEFLLDLTVLDLASTVKALRYCGSDPWSQDLIAVEQHLVKLLVSDLKLQSDVIVFASALTTYKALMVLNTALCQNASFVFETAVTHHQDDIEAAQRKIEED